MLWQSAGKQQQADLAQAREQLEDFCTTNRAQKAQLEALKSQFLQEREARVVLVVEQALQAGKITAAEAPSWRAGLLEDFEHGLKELSACTRKLNTESISQQLCHKQQSGHPATELVALAQARSEQLKESFSSSWCHLKQERPDLFSRLEAPVR